MYITKKNAPNSSNMKREVLKSSKLAFISEQNILPGPASPDPLTCRGPLPDVRTRTGSPMPLLIDPGDSCGRFGLFLRPSHHGFGSGRFGLDFLSDGGVGSDPTGIVRSEKVLVGEFYGTKQQRQHPDLQY